MTRRRVVITGLGAVTPIGNDAASLWKGLCEGRSGIGPITLFDASTFPTRIAGEIKAFDTRKWPSRQVSMKWLGRSAHFALEASEQAMSDAGLKSGVPDPRRFGVYFGAGDGGFDFVDYAGVVTRSMDAAETTVEGKKYFENSAGHIRPEILAEQEPYQAVNHLAAYFKAAGPVSNCLTACAASSQAIGEAAEIIRRGDADLMLSGGAHSMIHPLGLAGFNLLTALSTRNDEPVRASRPFDKERDGFVLSEGSGVLVLEEYEHALRRKARIYAELAGYGCTADAFRMTDPHPEGRGAIRAMRLALEDAALESAQIGYINAHGTSTQANDEIETHSIKQVFGASAARIPVSSIKSMLGHMIAAAGAVELIASVLTMRDSIIPPTINYENTDETCDLDYVPNRARAAKVRAVLSNSFGFGGQNVALIVKELSA